MMLLGIIFGLFFYLHGCISSPTVCDVLRAAKLLVLPTNSEYCDDHASVESSLCDDRYFASTLYSCNDNGEVRAIDLSGLGIFGATMHYILSVPFGF